MVDLHADNEGFSDGVNLMQRFANNLVPGGSSEDVGSVTELRSSASPEFKTSLLEEARSSQLRPFDNSQGGLAFLYRLAQLENRLKKLEGESRAVVETVGSLDARSVQHAEDLGLLKFSVGSIQQHFAEHFAERFAEQISSLKEHVREQSTRQGELESKVAELVDSKLHLALGPVRRSLLESCLHHVESLAAQTSTDAPRYQASEREVPNSFATQTRALESCLHHLESQAAQTSTDEPRYQASEHEVPNSLATQTRAEALKDAGLSAPRLDQKDFSSPHYNKELHLQDSAQMEMPRQQSSTPLLDCRSNVVSVVTLNDSMLAPGSSVTQPAFSQPPGKSYLMTRVNSQLQRITARNAQKPESRGTSVANETSM